MKKLHARELSRNQSVLRFDVILQHDWPIEQCFLHTRVFFGGKTKSPCFDLFTHWLIKQITNTYETSQIALFPFVCGFCFVRAFSFQDHTKIALFFSFSQFGGSTHHLNFDKFRDTCSSFNWAKYQQLTHFKGLNWQRDVVFLRWERVLLPWCTAHFLRRGKHDNKWNILVQFNNFTVVYSVKLRRLTNRKTTRRESPLQYRLTLSKSNERLNNTLQLFCLVGYQMWPFTCKLLTSTASLSLFLYWQFTTKHLKV